MKRLVLLGILWSLTLSLFGQSTIRVQQNMGKSAEEAYQQAVVNTVLPVAVGYGSVKLFNSPTVKSMGASLAVYGLVVGPSTGNLYAADYRRGVLGIIARAGAAYLLKDATAEVFGSEFARTLNVDDREVTFTDTGIWIGTVLMAGSAVYNIVSAGRSVEEFNQSGIRLSFSKIPFEEKVAPVITARVAF